MKYYALFYYVVGDYATQRLAFRDAHLKLAQAAQQRGELILAGAMTNPMDSALLVFRADDDTLPSDFARNDPYVRNGLVTRWEVRPWAVVAGSAFVPAGPAVT